MKSIILILSVITVSSVCNSQTSTIPNRDSSILIFKPLYFSSYNVSSNYFTKTFNSKFTLNKTFSLYDLLNDPKYINEMYCNNFTHSGEEMMYIYNNRFYSVKDPIHPYGSFQNTLFLGSLNYLFQRFTPSGLPNSQKD